MSKRIGEKTWVDGHQLKFADVCWTLFSGDPQTKRGTKVGSGIDSKRKNANIYEGKQKERERWLQIKIKIRICPFGLLPLLRVLKEGVIQILI